MLKKISILVLILLFVSKALHAFESGTIHGRVIDGFGNPVPFANITTVSDGAKVNVTSDQKGIFSVSYNPGNIRLSFGKEGYVPLYIPLSLDEGTELSVDDIIIWRIPPKGGLFVVGDNEYTEINSAEYYSESSSKEKRFYVKGSPSVIKGQNLKILDFQTDNPLVVGKTLYHVDSKDSLGSITLYPSQKYVMNKEEDAYNKIADNLGLRKTTLSPGRYFYCTGELTIRSKVGFGFFFEVTP